MLTKRERLSATHKKLTSTEFRIFCRQIKKILDCVYIDTCLPINKIIMAIIIVVAVINVGIWPPIFSADVVNNTTSSYRSWTFSALRFPILFANISTFPSTHQVRASQEHESCSGQRQIEPLLGLNHVHSDKVHKAREIG